MNLENLRQCLKVFNCFKINYEGEYYGLSIKGYAMYNYEVGLIYLRMDFEEGFQEIKLKEFISK